MSDESRHDLAHELVQQLWAVRAEFDRSVVDQVRILLLDHLGVTVRGSRSDSAVAARATFEDPIAATTGRSSTVIGVGRALSPLDAMLCNGIACHSIELDDVHLPSSTHPGAVIFPATLAIAEHADVGEDRFLDAIVSGYETIARVGAVATPSAIFGHGFHPTGPLGALGATIAVSRALDSSASTATDAIGLAADQASGSMNFLGNGGWSKHLHPGMAARTGTLAALLARNGYKGPRSPIEGLNGFLLNYGSGQGTVGVVESAEPAGSAVLATSLKPYPNCRYIHPVLDVISELRARHDFDPAAIEEIRIGLPPVAYDIVGLGNVVPETVGEAQFDTAFAVAVLLTTGSLTLASYERDVPPTATVRSLMDRVSCRPDEGLGRRYPDHWGAVVEIRVGDRWISGSVEDALGDPAKPLELDQAIAKFRELAGAVYPTAWVDDIARIITRFPLPGTLDALFSALRVAPDHDHPREDTHV